MKDTGEVFLFPPRWIPKELKWSNFVEAWNAIPFGRMYINSLVISILVTIGQLITCSLAAYAFARIDFPGRNKLFLISVFILVLGIFVSFFIATYISMSINRLDKELQEISRGNLKIELKKSKIKEFNNLINSFERILVSMKLAIARTKQENRKGKEETEKNNIRKF